MHTASNYVLWYWAFTGFLSACLFFTLNESHRNQRPDSGAATPLVRLALSFVFGGALLPLVFLITGAVNTAALVAELFEKKRAKLSIAEQPAATPSA